MKPTLFVTRPLASHVVDAARVSCAVTIRDSTRPLDEAEARKALQTYDIILPTLRDAFSKEAFKGDIKCRFLANFGVGYNHIDVDAAHAHGIGVSNTPGVVTDATADTALMLMLMTCRRAGEGERQLRNGQWGGWNPTELLGLHMTGKTLGIIGMGRIGLAIAQRAHFGFGMNIRFFNRSAKEVSLPAKQLQSIQEVMQASDIVVLAVPGGAQTHHLIGAAELAAMHPHAHLVNIARGDVVDEAALVHALQTGAIAGAGLDVYEFEPKVSPGLLEMENVVLLPHMGTSTMEVRIAMGTMAIENVVAFVRGETPPNLI